MNLSKQQRAIRAILSLHSKEAGKGGIGPYCKECKSSIDGGPELYPCKTVNSVMDALGRSSGKSVTLFGFAVWFGLAGLLTGMCAGLAMGLFMPTIVGVVLVFVSGAAALNIVNRAVVLEVEV